MSKRAFHRGAALASAAVIGSVLALAGADAQQRLKAAGPAEGDCKQAAEVGVSNSPAAAQQIWSTVVAGKYGNKWAIWVGAKDKAVVPINQNTYQAVAKPCFYQPVK